MPILNIGERLLTPSGRIDLAADVIGAMAHPKDKTDRRRRRSALAVTLLGMSDQDDEPEARLQVKGWFRRAGGFKTASESDPYSKQQNKVFEQIPKILAVGMALDLVWAMDAHHRETLLGGASLNKALAILQNPISSFPMSERSLRSAWSHYKPVAHLCAVFALAFQEAQREGTPDELDERMKNAYHEEFDVTLSLATAYQRFASGFIPHGQNQPLLDPQKIWLLRGVEPHDSWVPSPLTPEVLAIAAAYKAPRSVAYERRRRGFC
jgi:hypothetical protein